MNHISETDRAVTTDLTFMSSGTERRKKDKTESVLQEIMTKCLKLPKEISV